MGGLRAVAAWPAGVGLERHRKSPMTRSRVLSASAALALIGAAAAFLLLVACADSAKQSADSASGRAGNAVPSEVTRYSREQFAILRWIEGDWRGELPKGGYFYERYRFVDDSTIAMRGFEDSTFTTPNDSATIVFRDSVVTDRGPKAEWAATRLDAKGIDFAPTKGATNRFSWNRESADKWTAGILPARGNPTVYRMERLRPK